MIHCKVNPKMITLARESRGLTQGGLAKQLAVLQDRLITQGIISKIEQGLIGTSEEILDGLVKVLKYPPTFFYQNEEIYAAGMSLHRKRASLPAKTLSKIEATTNILRFHVKSLLKSVEDIETKYPHYDIDEYGDPEIIARFVRQAWLTPRGPIDNVTKLIEKAGILVIHCDFETRLIDGLTINVDKLPPIIFVNKDIPGDRMRFTLCHELGHIVMHKYPTLDMEKEADRFASELLMPSDDIKHNLSNLSLQKLADLKLFWKVAMSALIMKATSLNKITPWQSQYLWRQFSKLGYKTREPAELDVPREKPSILKKLVDIHIKDLNYSVNEIAKILHLEEEELFGFYIEKPLSSRGLSIVK